MPKINGKTQIKPDSIPLGALEPSLAALISSGGSGTGTTVPVMVDVNKVNYVLPNPVNDAELTQTGTIPQSILAFTPPEGKVLKHRDTIYMYTVSGANMNNPQPHALWYSDDADSWFPDDSLDYNARQKQIFSDGKLFYLFFDGQMLERESPESILAEQARAFAQQIEDLRKSNGNATPLKLRQVKVESSTNVIKVRDGILFSVVSVNGLITEAFTLTREGAENVFTVNEVVEPGDKIVLTYLTDTPAAPVTPPPEWPKTFGPFDLTLGGQTTSFTLKESADVTVAVVAGGSPVALSVRNSVGQTAGSVEDVNPRLELGTQVSGVYYIDIIDYSNSVNSATVTVSIA